MHSASSWFQRIHRLPVQCLCLLWLLLTPQSFCFGDRTQLKLLLFFCTQEHHLASDALLPDNQLYKVCMDHTAVLCCDVVLFSFSAPYSLTHDRLGLRYFPGNSCSTAGNRNKVKSATVWTLSLIGVVQLSQQRTEIFSVVQTETMTYIF